MDLFKETILKAEIDSNLTNEVIDKVHGEHALMVLDYINNNKIDSSKVNLDRLSEKAWDYLTGVVDG